MGEEVDALDLLLLEDVGRHHEAASVSGVDLVRDDDLHESGAWALVDEHSWIGLEIADWVLIHQAGHGICFPFVGCRASERDEEG